MIRSASMAFDVIPKKPKFTFAVLALAVTLIFVFLEPLRDVYEVASITIFPDANRAFELGERHFSSSTRGAAYNIDLADYFFAKAQEIDPSLQYLYHERARVAFIKGRLDAALVLINLQIEAHGSDTPNSYYVRGLIEGYMGEYTAAAKDYEYFLKFDPRDWAGLNDYSWVLLKAKRPKDAADAIERGLKDFPNSPWLLNSEATALYELGRYSEAMVFARRASAAVQNLSEAEWSHSYPGNDPATAGEGVQTFKEAVAANIHTIESTIATSTIQSR